jgi:hypothetical protein
MEGVGEAEVRRGLAELERKQLIRPARLSAVEAEAEWPAWPGCPPPAGSESPTSGEATHGRRRQDCQDDHDLASGLEDIVRASVPALLSRCA